MSLKNLSFQAVKLCLSECYIIIVYQKPYFVKYLNIFYCKIL